jgi:chromosome segregation ATPase
MTNEKTDNVTWICPDCQSVTVDPADVTALQAAHDALKDENKRLTELLRGDRMIVATRINHEYTKAKGVIRELQAENERLRALLENTRQQRDDAYSERAEAQKVIKEFELQLKILGDIVDSQNERQKTIISLLKAQP